MSNRHDDLQLALGCVEYDMHVLAMALLIHREGVSERQDFPDAYPELVASAILVKARSLVEFLTSTKNQPGRITLRSFGISPRKDPTLNTFLGYASQHSVHLDWKRARDPLFRRAAKYDEALTVLRECASACAMIRDSGVSLQAPRHRKRHQVLQSQLARLGIDMA